MFQVEQNSYNFSITGDLLPGFGYTRLQNNFGCIDYAAHVLMVQDDDCNTYTVAYLELSKFSDYARYPLLSTFSGFGRALLGVIHTVGHFALLIFALIRNGLGIQFEEQGRGGVCGSDICRHRIWEHDIELIATEMLFGCKQVFTGLYEMIPIVGNLISYYQQQQFLKDQVSRPFDSSSWINYSVTAENGRSINGKNYFLTLEECTDEKLLLLTRESLGQEKFSEISRRYQKIQADEKEAMDKGLEQFANMVRNLPPLPE